MSARSELFRLWSVIFCFGALILMVSPAVGVGVTLSGNILVSQMLSDGKAITQSYTVNFQLSLRDLEWRLTTTESNDHTDVNAFDGTNLYDFYIFSDQTIARLSRAGKINTKIDAPAYICDGSYPFYRSGPATQVIWFAFLSGPFLVTRSNDLPSLWSKVGDMDLNGHLSKLSKLRFNTESREWPVEAEFVYSKQALLERRTNVAYLSSRITSDQIEAAARDIGDLDNHPVAQYEVVSTTNFEGKTLPLSFEFDVVAEKGPPPLKRWTIESFVGTVTNLSDETPEKIVPDAPDGIWVTDFRFSDRQRRIDSISYAPHNGVWPTRDDAKIQEEFTNLRARTPIYTEGILRRGRFMFLIIILLAGLPLAFGLLKSRLKNTKPIT
jgi:hypothetical protein